MSVAQRDQPVTDARAQHGLHGVGQHQHGVTAIQRIAEHGDHVGIHERLAAGEADLAHRQAIACDLIEKGSRLGAGKISEPVVVGARVDVAIAACDVAQAAGVEPQRAQAGKCDTGAALALGGHVGVAEFRVRREKRGVGHGYALQPPALTGDWRRFARPETITTL